MANEPMAVAACAPLSNGTTWMVIRPLSPLIPASRASRPVHDQLPADLLVQGGLADQQVDVRLALAQDCLLPGQGRLDGSFACGIIGKALVGRRECPRVGPGSVAGLSPCDKI
jgi:hypothetical protein